MKNWFKYLAVVTALGLFAVFIYVYIMVNSAYQSKLARTHNWDGRKFCLELSERAFLGANENERKLNSDKVFNSCETNFKRDWSIVDYLQ
jgi:hypothetical protein